MIRALAILLLLRLSLASIGYGKLARLLARFARMSPVQPSSEEEIERIVWAVSTAGRLALGEKPCLPLAMTTQWLLSRRGVATEMRIGALRDPAGRLKAHAWVEREGRVLIGQTPGLEHFAVLR